MQGFGNAILLTGDIEKYLLRTTLVIKFYYIIAVLDIDIDIDIDIEI